MCQLSHNLLCLQCPFVTWPWPFLSMRLLLILHINHTYDNTSPKFELSDSISPVSRAQNVKHTYDNTLQKYELWLMRFYQPGPQASKRQKEDFDPTLTSNAMSISSFRYFRCVIISNAALPDSLWPLVREIALEASPPPSTWGCGNSPGGVRLIILHV